MTAAHQSIPMQIWQAVSKLIAGDMSKEFTNGEVSHAIGLSNYHMGSSFQGMRADQPGGAPKVQQRLQKVFRRVRQGHFVLSDYGIQLMRETIPAAITATQDLEDEIGNLEQSGFFNARDAQDQRARVLSEIAQRSGQPKFRKQLLEAYQQRCCITGCNAVYALEAAHISAYSGPRSNAVENGLLLRADIHTLFDLNLLGICPSTKKVELSPFLQQTDYSSIEGIQVRLPTTVAYYPSENALQVRWEHFKGRSVIDEA